MMRSFIFMLLIVAGSVETAFGVLVASHSGQADPVTEGWTASAGSPPSGISVGAITNDGGSGFDAWFVDDNSTGGGSSFFYSQTPTAAQLSQASTQGWKLTARLRVTDIDDSPGTGSVFVQYGNGTTVFDMVFGSDSDGDPIVVLDDGTVSGGEIQGPSFTSEGSGGGYHLYELAFDATENSADLFVDGVERISDFTGFSFAVPRVAFGGGSSADTGQGNYNLVQFTAIPEPSAFLFGGLVSLLVTSSIVVKRNRTDDLIEEC